MRIQRLVCVTAAMATLTVTSVAYGQAKPRVVEITGNDQMKFSVTTIAAKPGEILRIRLKSIGTLPKMVMSHNFVLLAKGTDATAFANAAATSGATGYIPASMKGKILGMTALAGPGETVEATIRAPSAAGAYTYLCSFTGHFLSGMKGTLVVK